MRSASSSLAARSRRITSNNVERYDLLCLTNYLAVWSIRTGDGRMTNGWRGFAIPTVSCSGS